MKDTLVRVGICNQKGNRIEKTKTLRIVGNTRLVPGEIVSLAPDVFPLRPRKYRVLSPNRVVLVLGER